MYVDMTLYNEQILPKIVDRICRSGPMSRQRQKIIPQASGHILEIGIGSGLNLPFYDTRKVKSLTGLEPSAKMASMAVKRAKSTGISLEILYTGADNIPLPSGVMDSVTMTYTLCTIPDAVSALKQMHRVLKPGGKLYFCEHGLAPDPKIQGWQNRLTPMWKVLAGGCHLNRNIPELILKGRFSIKHINTMYLPGWRPGMFNYWGIAEKSL